MTRTSCVSWYVGVLYFLAFPILSLDYRLCTNINFKVSRFPFRINRVFNDSATRIILAIKG
jgi:hypothetical protein